MLPAVKAAAIEPMGMPRSNTPQQHRPAGPPPVFTKLDEMVSSVWNNPLPGYRNDWQEIEGCWVLRPPLGQPIQAVVHFVGAPFVGAAPQLCYRLFLEALALRNVMVSRAGCSRGNQSGTSSCGRLYGHPSP